MFEAFMILQVKVNGFSEADQENLYHLAHDKKGQGRQGLGIAGRPKKVQPSLNPLHDPCELAQLL